MMNGFKKSKTDGSECDLDDDEGWDSRDDGMLDDGLLDSSYMSTRDSVVRSEAEKAGAELAGQATVLTKEKTGYQLYHMHRVAEIKRDLGVKHHEAFKRAAKDWSRLPESEKEWYNNRADKKPIGRAAKIVGYEDNNSLRVVSNAVSQMVVEVDLHTGTVTPAPPRMVVALMPVENNLMPFDNSNNSHPRNVDDDASWACSLCGIGDAGAPKGVCLMCAAFGTDGI
jgi:hypothetical protein